MTAALTGDEFTVALFIARTPLEVGSTRCLLSRNDVEPASGVPEGETKPKVD